MTFDYPVILFFLFILLPMLVIDIFYHNKIKNISDELKKKLFLSALFFRLFLALVIIAISGPRWGMGYAASEFRRGLDIVYALDVSRSMDIRDVQTGNAMYTRLERGIQIAEDSINSVSGARYATAIGRGRGYLAVPLTHDSEAPLVFLEALDSSAMTGRSTNLEALVEAAANAFQNTSPARKVIVLISDGESHSGVLRNAINICARDGIIVTAVAVGSDEGRQIAAQANDPAEMVISRRDAVVMRSSAERTGGIYIDGNREDAAALLSSHLISLAQETENQNGRQEPRQRRVLFIVLAMIFYAASKFVTRSLHTQRAALVSLVSIIFLFTSCSESKMLLLEANYLKSRGRYEEALVSYFKALNHNDSAPYAEYGIGLVFYSLDDGKQALTRYGDSLKLLENITNNEHRELRFRNHYNSGIILFEEGEYQSAADAFKDALRTEPRSMDAKRNLELSLMSITTEANAEGQSDVMQEQWEILFDYMKFEEEQHWRSREWAPEENFSGLDY